jgi:hypothetical protein
MNTLEFWLTLGVSLAVLAISVFVLVVERLVLRRISDEVKERGKLIGHLLDTQRVFTRSEYIRVIAEVVDLANSEIVFIASAALETQADREALAVLEAAKRRALDVRKVNKYQAIVSRDKSKLATAWVLKKTGVKVLVHDELSMTDLNFTIADKNTAVIGVPDQPGAPSTRGFVVHSGTLISLLLEKYAELECKARPLEEFATEIALEMRHLGFTIEKISERTGIDSEFLNSQLLNNPPP